MAFLCMRDETGAQSLLRVNASGQVDFGGSNPTDQVSVDGTSWVTSAELLGNTRAPSSSLNRSTGQVTIGADATAVITHSLGRRALFMHEQTRFQRVFIVAHTTTTVTLRNIGGSSVTVEYSYT